MYKRQVHLVGAGPGAADLITVRGLKLLRSADVVLHDRLVSPELLTEIRLDAEVVDVGKAPGEGGAGQGQIDALLVARAQAGFQVVRLKGGDPGLFGRSGEELTACRAAGVPCLITPGVSSIFAAAAELGVPLTWRGLAQSVGIWTARTHDGELDENGLGRVAGADTLIVMMGRAALPEVIAALRNHGRAPETPAACISAAKLACSMLRNSGSDRTSARSSGRISAP